ncbi:hypothetical protein VSK92_05370 [Bacillus swezeyi]|uniref:hypothetical protein n=1 Tax=Bacillus swezeyi TaxID=1925020 RepID=UPI0039C6CFE0
MKFNEKYRFFRPFDKRREYRLKDSRMTAKTRLAGLVSLKREGINSAFSEKGRNELRKLFEES